MCLKGMIFIVKIMNVSCHSYKQYLYEITQGSKLLIESEVIIQDLALFKIW